jgi:predicted transcriptional regulator
MEPKSSQGEKKGFSVRLDSDLSEKVELAARILNTSANELFTRAIEAELEKIKQDSDFREQAIAYSGKIATAYSALIKSDKVFPEH